MKFSIIIMIIIIIIMIIIIIIIIIIINTFGEQFTLLLSKIIMCNTPAYCG